MDSPSAPPPAPRSFVGLVADAVDAWRKQWLRLLIVTGLAAAVIAAAAAALFVMAYAGDRLGRADAIARTAAAVLALVLAWILARLAVAWLALVAGAEDGARLGAAWAAGKGRALSYLWTSLLSSLVVAGGCLLLVVPGVIWAVSFAVLPWVFISERLSGFAALTRARRLVRGDGWRTLLHLLALSLLFGAVGLLGAAGERLLGGNRAALIAWQGFWYAVNIVAVTPVSACFVHAMYVELRRRKDAALTGRPERKTPFLAAAVLGGLAAAASLGLLAYGLLRLGSGFLSGFRAGLVLREAATETTLPPSAETPPPVEPTPPFEIDADRDGLNDATELRLGTDPENPDADGDGLADGDEARVFLTSPARASTAGSPYDDGTNLKNGSDPLMPGVRMTEEGTALVRGRILANGLHEPTLKTLGGLYR